MACFPASANVFLTPAVSGNIAKWHVKEGDTVSAGESIADIETDKAIMALEIQDDGVIAKILQQEGASGIKVGEPVCIVVEDAASVAAFKDYTSGDAAASASDAPSPPPATATDSKPAPSQAAAGPRSEKIGPAARKLLEGHGLSMRDVSPTGPQGIVTKGDVLSAIAAGVTASPAPSPTAPAKAAAESPAPKAAPKTSGAPAPAAPPALNARSTPGRRGRGVDAHADAPNTQMRRIIAKRLLESKRTTPAVYVSQDAVLTSLTDLRAELKAAGTKLSVNDFVIKAAGMALKAVPGACAGWDAKQEAAELYGDVDISVAVATPGGLITPIVRGADAKTLVEISRTVKDLAGRARDNKLAPHEFTGGSFTISNLGMYGISDFAAIINPPQACILAVGGSQQKTVLQNGVPATVDHMTVTLSTDGRVVDEETAAEFLKGFVHYIENPASLMMQ